MRRDDEAMIKVLQPDFFSKFKCNGEACGAACCRRWVVDIDAATKKKYDAIKLKALKGELRRSISVKEINGMKKNVVKLKHDGSCPFLMDNNLCKIQRICGEDFLSDTCRSYPRIVSKLGNDYTRSLSISCPLAAELVLLQTEPIRLETAEARPADLVNINRSPENNVEAIPILRDVAIKILQNKHYALDERLILLGAFLDRADELLSDSKPEAVPACGAAYNSLEFADQAQGLFSLCTGDKTVFIRYMLEVMEAVYGEGNRTYEHQSPQEYIDDTSKAYGISTGDNSISAIAGTYFAQYEKYGRQLFQEYGQVWENYLVYQYFTDNQPYFFEGGVNMNFGYYLTVCKFTEFIALASLAVNKERFTAQSLVKIMSYVEQKTVHIQPCKETLKRILKQHDKDILALMQMLIARP